jgi:hypothetical protein
VKTYQAVSTPGLSQLNRDFVASGHSLLYSISPSEPSGNRFTFDALVDIAAGKYDAAMLPQLQALNGIRTTPYVVFDGEPENVLETRACSKPGDHKVCGPEFVAAWRHVRDLAASRGLTRLRWIWNLTANLYNDDLAAVDLYFPGTTYVDWIGVDPYNQSCGVKASSYAAQTFERLMEPVMRWRESHAATLPISLTEWGAPELAGNANARADWLRDAAAYAKRTPSIQMMVYWDGGGDTFSGCDFSIRPGQPAFDAFRSIGADPYFARSD